MANSGSNRNGTNAAPSGQRGLSMVETLLAMGLSLVLILVVSQIYLGSKQSYALQEAQSRLQENGRYAMAILARDIRRAGNMGCSSIKKAPVILAKSVPQIAPATAIMGYDANNTIAAYPYATSETAETSQWNPNAPDSLKAEDGSLKVVAGTDILSIQFAEPCGGGLQAKVEGMKAGPTASLVSTNTCPIQPDSDVLILSDCGQTEIFRADSVSPIKISGTSNNTMDHFTYTHDVDAEVMLFHSHTYFIRLFNDEPTLYRQEDTEVVPTAQPILEGVEDMQILYGVDGDPADGSVDRYLTARNASGLWPQVIAVRIDLVVRSSGDDGKYLTSTSANACNGVTVNDRRLRKCYSFTVNLRNPRS